MTGLLSLLEDLRGQESRSEEDRRLLIVIGDFNFDSSSVGYKRLVSEAGLQSAANSSTIADYEAEDGSTASVSYSAASVAAAEDVGDASTAKKVHSYPAAAEAKDVDDGSTTNHVYYYPTDFVPTDADDDSTTQNTYFSPATTAAGGVDSRPSFYHSRSTNLEASYDVAVPVKKRYSSLREILRGDYFDGGAASSSVAVDANRDGVAAVGVGNDGSSNGGDIQANHDGGDGDDGGGGGLDFAFFAAEDDGVSLGSYEVHYEFSQERYADGYPSVTEFEISCPSLSSLEGLRQP